MLATLPLSDNAQWMIIATVTLCICVCSILCQAFTDFNCFLTFEQPCEMPVMVLTLQKN